MIQKYLRTLTFMALCSQTSFACDAGDDQNVKSFAKLRRPLIDYTLRYLTDGGQLKINKEIRNRRIFKAGLPHRDRLEYGVTHTKVQGPLTREETAKRAEQRKKVVRDNTYYLIDSKKRRIASKKEKGELIR